MIKNSWQKRLRQNKNGLAPIAVAIILMAVVAVSATSYVAIDNLTQQPEPPETVIYEVESAPFSFIGTDFGLEQVAIIIVGLIVFILIFNKMSRKRE